MVENGTDVTVKMKDGSIFRGSGQGLLMAEDFDDEEEQYDTFSIFAGGKGIALRVDDIEDAYVN